MPKLMQGEMFFPHALNKHPCAHTPYYIKKSIYISTRTLKMTSTSVYDFFYINKKCQVMIEGRNDELETQNWEKIPFSLQIVQRGLSVAEGP